MRHYDLYGNSYKSSQEALNAEMAQCNEIDNRINDEYRQKMNRQQGYMKQHIKTLEKKIIDLEKLIIKE